MVRRFLYCLTISYSLLNTNIFLLCHNCIVNSPCTICINRVSIWCLFAGVHCSAVSIGALLKVVAAELSVTALDPVPTCHHSSLCIIRSWIQIIPSSIDILKPASLHHTVSIKVEPGSTRLSCTGIRIADICPCGSKILSCHCVLKVPFSCCILTPGSADAVCRTLRG